MTTQAIAPVVTSSALQPTIEAMEVQRYADGIRAENNARDAQATITALGAQATATASAIDAQYTAVASAATLTAAAHQSTATAEAQRRVDQEARLHATATAETKQIAATATAQIANANATATSTAGRATSTVEAANWSHNATATVAAWSIQATATVEAHNAWITIQAAEARRAELDLHREETIAPLRTYGPWIAGSAFMILIIAVIAGVVTSFLKVYEIQNSAIQRDERGDAPLLLIDPKRGWQIADPDLAQWPILTGAESQPRADEETQAAIKRRDQMLDIGTRGSTGRRARGSARQTAIQEMSRTPGFQVLKRGTAPPQALIDRKTMLALEDQWKEEKR
jgi:hypothetical protein